MAGATLLRRSVDVTDEQGGHTTYVQVSAVDKNNELWSQVMGTLLNNLAQAGYSQPNEVIQESVESDRDPWRIVAPGMMLRTSEYQERYSHLDLADLKQKLGDKVFQAFVRNIGTVRGPQDVDVNELMREELS